MIVYKFGGTSVGTPERMHKVARLITGDRLQKVVVLSAVSGTTNALVSIGNNLLSNSSVEASKEINALEDHYHQFIAGLYVTEEGKQKGEEIVTKAFAEIRDMAASPFTQEQNNILLGKGELLSTQLFQRYLQESKMQSTLLPALDFMSIDENKEPEIPRIRESLGAILSSHKNELYITQGFICLNHKGKVDNLGRGGSDYTASLIGAALQAEEVQIWTDIDGLHNNDPRVVDHTSPVAALSFDEAAELAYFGAKILHPSSILPAQKFGIPVRLKSTMKEEAPGTIISNRSGEDGAVKAIAAKDGIVAIKIKSTRMLLAYGFLRKIFEVFEKYKTPIDMITTSEVAVSLTIDQDSHLSEIVEELSTFGFIEVDREQTIICLVGNLVSTKPGMVKHVFDALDAIPVRMVSYGGSRNNISMLIDTRHKSQALYNLHHGLFADVAFS